MLEMLGKQRGRILSGSGLCVHVLDFFKELERSLGEFLGCGVEVDVYAC